jgi:hypothetical protein
MTQNDDDDDDDNNNNNNNIPLLKNYVLRLYGVIHNYLTRCKKSVHLNGAKDGSILHTDRRETLLLVSLYVPWVLSYVGGCQGCRLSENGDANRESILRA